MRPTSSVEVKWYDAFFLSMLAISAIVISINWKRYQSCSYPLHIWIVVDYATIFAFRILMVVDSWLSTGLLRLDNDNQYSTMRENVRLVVLACLGILLYPFLWAWTITGCIWFASAKACVSDGQKWGFLAWLLFSFTALICLACLCIGKWLLRRQAHLQQIPSGSTVSDWQVLLDMLRVPDGVFEAAPPRQDMRGTFEMATYHPGLFLTQSQREVVDGLIQQLPKFSLKVVPAECSECPICLEEFSVGSEVRGLPCAHNFHVECIDQWLRLNIKCPRCRCSVFPNLDLSALGNGSTQRTNGVTSIYFGGSGAGNANNVTTRSVRAAVIPVENDLSQLQETLQAVRTQNSTMSS